MNNVNFHNYQMQILSHLILNMDLFVFVIFEFLSVVTMMNIVPKDVLPHSQVEIKWHFGGMKMKAAYSLKL